MKKLLSTLCASVYWLGLSFNSVAHSDIGECTVDSYSEEYLYQFNGRNFKNIDFPVSLQAALYDAELQYYKAQKAIVDQAILLTEVERLAQESGRSNEDVVKELFYVDPPAREEVEEFYERNKEQIAAPLEAVEIQIVQALIQQKAQERQVRMLEELKETNGFELTLPKPVAPHAELAIDGFPRKGANNPKVTIVEFADYQCPHCQKAAEVLSEMLDRYPDDLEIVYVDFPINRSGISRIVAEGAVCANQQGMFWKYHDLVYADQVILNENTPTQIAEALKLDMTSFEACLMSPSPKEHVRRAEDEALRLGLTSTPTLFLNGRRLHLHDLSSELPIEIESELNRNG